MRLDKALELVISKLDGAPAVDEAESKTSKKVTAKKATAKKATAKKATAKKATAKKATAKKTADSEGDK